MEKAKISAYQLFVLIVLFEIGSAVLVPLAIGAKQDAWLAILIAMIGGFFLLFRLFWALSILPRSAANRICERHNGKLFRTDFGFSLCPLFCVSRSKGVAGFRRDAVDICLSGTLPYSLRMAYSSLLLCIQFGKESKYWQGPENFLLSYCHLVVVTFIILIVASGLIQLS